MCYVIACVSVHLSVHLSVHPSIHFSYCSSVCLSVLYVGLSICLCVCPHVHLSVRSIRLSSICSACLSLCISEHLSICLSGVRPSAPVFCCSACWSVCLCRFIVFRLASSEELRLVESSQALVAKLNAMALTKFNRDIDKEKESVSRQRRVRCAPDLFYKDRFVRKVGASTHCEV